MIAAFEIFLCVCLWHQMGLGVRKYASARLDVVGTQSTCISLLQIWCERTATHSAHKRGCSVITGPLRTLLHYSIEFNYQSSFIRFMHMELFAGCLFVPSYRVSTAPPFSSEFLKDLDRLPRYYNSSTSSHYKDFLHTYGTHYIHQVKRYMCLIQFVYSWI